MSNLNHLKNQLNTAPSVIRSSAIARLIGLISLSLSFISAITGLGYFFNLFSINLDQEEIKYSSASGFLVIAVLLLLIRHLTKKIRERNKFIFDLQMVIQDLKDEDNNQ